MTTPHQTENHYFEVDREDTGLKFEGYENATDEEKTKMMLQIAKEANAEQKAMFERTCLCKDKGVIELIEEAVEAERAKYKEYREGLVTIGKELDWLMGKLEDHQKNRLKVLNERLDALQVINKEEIPRNPLDQNKWM